MHGYEATSLIVYLLRESHSAFIHINFFDVSSASAGAAKEFANVSSTAIGQFFPIFELPFVLRAGRQRRSDRNNRPSLQQCNEVRDGEGAVARSPRRRSPELIAADTAAATGRWR